MASILTGIGVAVGDAEALAQQVPSGETKEKSSIVGPGSLKSHGGQKGLLTGCAIGAEQLRNDQAFRAVVVEQYNLLVAENCMKFAGLRPTPDSYSFEDADALVAFAEQHGMKVRGHNFVWHEALPTWFEATVTNENARQFLTEHILTVGRRYRGKIHSWDVVNEAIWVKDGRPDGLRNSPWMQRIGAGYIELAYRTARQADNNAKLTYNEYGIEYDTPEQEAKRAATLSLLRRLKASGAPLDALGIQSHIRAGSQTIGRGLRELIAAAQALGLEVYVTELDVNEDDVTNDDVVYRDAVVADVYGNYLRTALASKAVKAILTWGVTDKHTWLNNDKTHKEEHPGRAQRALPFDAELRPKRAFFAIRAAIDAAPSR